MKILRTLDSFAEKKQDGKLSEDVLKKASMYKKQAGDLVKSIQKEFDVGLKGGNFSAGYIKEKTDALARLAKLMEG